MPQRAIESPQARRNQSVQDAAPASPARAEAADINAFTASLSANAIQLKALDAALIQFRSVVDARTMAEDVPAIAASGIGGAGAPLPHLDQIQRSFGHHDISSVRAHTGSAAQQATQALNARAYASGDDVVLGARGTDLHTVAHESAHVIQQRSGIPLKGGAGQAGDEFERHADQVADCVVRGESAVPLLDLYAGRGQRAPAATGIQFKEDEAPEQQGGVPRTLALKFVEREFMGGKISGSITLTIGNPPGENAPAGQVGPTSSTTVNPDGSVASKKTVTAKANFDEWLNRASGGGDLFNVLGWFGVNSDNWEVKLGLNGSLEAAHEQKMTGNVKTDAKAAVQGDGTSGIKPTVSGSITGSGKFTMNTGRVLKLSLVGTYAMDPDTFRAWRNRVEVDKAERRQKRRDRKALKNKVKRTKELEKGEETLKKEKEKLTGKRDALDQRAARYDLPDLASKADTKSKEFRQLAAALQGSPGYFTMDVHMRMRYVRYRQLQTMNPDDLFVESELRGMPREKFQQLDTLFDAQGIKFDNASLAAVVKMDADGARADIKAGLDDIEVRRDALEKDLVRQLDQLETIEAPWLDPNDPMATPERRKFETHLQELDGLRIDEAKAKAAYDEAPTTENKAKLDDLSNQRRAKVVEVRQSAQAARGSLEEVLKTMAPSQKPGRLNDPIRDVGKKLRLAQAEDAQEYLARRKELLEELSATRASLDTRTATEVGKFEATMKRDATATDKLRIRDQVRTETTTRSRELLNELNELDGVANERGYGTKRMVSGEVQLAMDRLEGQYKQLAQEAVDDAMNGLMHQWDEVAKNVDLDRLRTELVDGIMENYKARALANNIELDDDTLKHIRQSLDDQIRYKTMGELEDPSALKLKVQQIGNDEIPKKFLDQLPSYPIKKASKVALSKALRFLPVVGMGFDAMTIYEDIDNVRKALNAGSPEVIFEVFKLITDTIGLFPVVGDAVSIFGELAYAGRHSGLLVAQDIAREGLGPVLSRTLDHMFPDLETKLQIIERSKNAGAPRQLGQDAAPDGADPAPQPTPGAARHGSGGGRGAKPGELRGPGEPRDVSASHLFSKDDPAGENAIEVPQLFPIDGGQGLSAVVRDDRKWAVGQTYRFDWQGVWYEWKVTKLTPGFYGEHTLILTRGAKTDPPTSRKVDPEAESIPVDEEASSGDPATTEGDEPVEDTAGPLRIIFHEDVAKLLIHDGYGGLKLAPILPTGETVPVADGTLTIKAVNLRIGRSTTRKDWEEARIVFTVQYNGNNGDKRTLTQVEKVRFVRTNQGPMQQEDESALTPLREAFSIDGRKLNYTKNAEIELSGTKLQLLSAELRGQNDEGNYVIFARMKVLEIGKVKYLRAVAGGGIDYQSLRKDYVTRVAIDMPPQ